MINRRTLLSVVTLAVIAAALLIAGCGSDSGLERLPDENSFNGSMSSVAQTV